MYMKLRRCRHGKSFHPRLLVAQETKKTTKLDLTDTSMTCAATPPVEGFRFLLSRAMTGERRKEMVIGFFDISRAHFHSPVGRRVEIRVPNGDPPCPSGVAMLNRAMYGTKDAAQCFPLYCERTMEQLDNRIGEFNLRLYKHAQSKTSVCSDTATTLRRHGNTG